MIPSAFDEENAILDPPPGVPQEAIASISVYRGELDNGCPAMISCWKPTQEELAEIQRTGRVWVLVMGHTVPPIAITGISPFSRSDSTPT